jgi:hypothetical protein
VLDVAVTLGSLCAEVDHVASEEEVVSGLNSHGVAHESSAVTDKSCGHGTGDAVVEAFVSFTFQRTLLACSWRMRNRSQPHAIARRTSRGLSGCP